MLLGPGCPRIRVCLFLLLLLLLLLLLAANTSSTSSEACVYCQAPDSLIERDYVSVCQVCGYENESCRIQEHAVLLPITNINCGSLKDARKLDAMYKDIGVCVDMVENDLRRIQADGLVN